MSNLNQQLADFQEQFEAGAAPFRVTPEQVAVMHRFDEELRATGILSQVLGAGARFPAFDLPNQDGENVRLSSLLAKGPLVVSFFRGVWCPYCNIELAALEAARPEIEATGASLVAISPQLAPANRKARKDNSVQFDILTDASNAFAGRLNLAYRLGDELIEKVYGDFGVDLAQFNGDASWRLPLSSRFVIDTNGVIIAADADVNYRRRPEPSETIAVLRHLADRRAA